MGGTSFLNGGMGGWARKKNEQGGFGGGGASHKYAGGGGGGGYSGGQGFQYIHNMKVAVEVHMNIQIPIELQN